MENQAPETSREGRSVFHEFDKHLLIVSDTAAALADAGINLNSRASPPRAHEIAVPSQNERWDLREPRGFDCQFFVVAIALWIVLGLGFRRVGFISIS